MRVQCVVLNRTWFFENSDVSIEQIKKKIASDIYVDESAIAFYHPTETTEVVLPMDGMRLFIKIKVCRQHDPGFGD